MIITELDLKKYLNLPEDYEEDLSIYVLLLNDVVVSALDYDPEVGRVEQYIEYPLQRVHLNKIPYINDMRLNGKTIYPLFVRKGEWLYFKKPIQGVLSYNAGYFTSDTLPEIINIKGSFDNTWQEESYNRKLYLDVNYDNDYITPEQTTIKTMPQIIKITALRILALLRTESNGNIGITSKSNGESGDRTFVSFNNLRKYTMPLNEYRRLLI